MPPTIAAVPKFVSGAQTYTPPQPTVAVPAPLGTTANRHECLEFLDDRCVLARPSPWMAFMIFVSHSDGAASVIISERTRVV
eukprot:scaffold46095_cov70-Attheya_sp.AAC.6